MNCLWCEEVILPSEVMPHAPLTQMHRECVLRNTLGSAGHLQRQCSCYGGVGTGDPPDATKRDAARLAVVEFTRRTPNSLTRSWPIAERLNLRPSNFNDLTGEEQWSIDKALGLLDWKGTVLS